MGLFDTRRKQLEALEREVISNPTPQNMVALVEKHIAAGNEKSALEVAKKAVERFPDSEQCVSSYQNVRKMQLQRDIQDLNKALRKNPSAATYERLANIYLNELGNRNKAFEVAMQGLNKFPSNDGLHLTCGVIRMDRFHNDYLANDANEAIRHLQESHRGNPQNIKSLIYLARLYAEIGVYNEAIQTIDKALEFDPHITSLINLRDLIEQHMSEGVDFADDALMDIEGRHGLTPIGLEMRQIFEPVAQAKAVLRISPSKIEQHLQAYERISGYKCAAVLTEDAEYVAAHTRGDVPRDAFVAVVQRIMKNTLESAKRMDIGAFVNGDIETPIGGIRLAAWQNLVLALLADQPAKKDDVDAMVQRFVSFASLS